jgi:hypothetical protein
MVIWGLMAVEMGFNMPEMEKVRIDYAGREDVLKRFDMVKVVELYVQFKAVMVLS